MGWVGHLLGMFWTLHSHKTGGGARTFSMCDFPRTNQRIGLLPGEETGGEPGKTLVVLYLALDSVGGVEDGHFLGRRHYQARPLHLPRYPLEGVLPAAKIITSRHIALTAGRTAAKAARENDVKSWRLARLACLGDTRLEKNP